MGARFKAASSREWPASQSEREREREDGPARAGRRRRDQAELVATKVYERQEPIRQHEIVNARHFTSLTSALRCIAHAFAPEPRNWTDVNSGAMQAARRGRPDRTPACTLWWNGGDDHGNRLVSGVCFHRPTAGKDRAQPKRVLVGQERRHAPLEGGSRTTSWRAPGRCVALRRGHAAMECPRRCRQASPVQGTLCG